MQHKKHALVIGGTGMLSNVCIALARKGNIVSIIGRTKSKFQRIISESPVDSIFPILVDYNSSEVINEVEKVIEEKGSFDLIVSWTPNYNQLERICEMNSGIDKFRLFHVKGSRRYFKDDKIRVPDNCNYREVFLGFIIEDDRSRWLTHDEISTGVINQIDTDQVTGVVGKIEPYELRP
ncbi:short-chain dehydrogenase [Sporosarcina sp. Marseille-Q4063]|uniref:short-chain dehydrogenase n=1 Tax=Sporosarcina sp. Marseille-Q4063 TaxID=2810514 RepID=UPI001BB094A3|nr:short-chain dehydrogenase [Sporosarcina sp. Marseille-Q4063]QUW22007.1 short-chain dehydrogenase [Sporosarcina sp. Marseille-Q4063]